MLITLFYSSYRVIWVFKDTIFPDKSFKMNTSYLGGLVTSFVLILYCSIAFLIINDSNYRIISVDRLFCSRFCYLFKVILMIIADSQKTFTLEIKKSLISNQVFAWTKNLNYLREISLYLDFGILV